MPGVQLGQHRERDSVPKKKKKKRKRVISPLHRGGHRPRGLACSGDLGAACHGPSSPPMHMLGGASQDRNTKRGYENHETMGEARGSGKASWRRQHLGWQDRAVSIWHLRKMPAHAPCLMRHIPVVPVPPTRSGPGELGLLEKGVLSAAASQQWCLPSRRGRRGRGQP